MLQVVLDEDHREVELVADLEHEPRHVLGLLEVHPRDRLVEQQDARIHRERAPELDPLLDSVRQRADRFVAVRPGVRAGR